MYCKYCGNKIDPDSVFCCFCGKQLFEETKNTVLESDRTNVLEEEKEKPHKTSFLKSIRNVFTRRSLLRFLRIIFIFLAFYVLILLVCLVYNYDPEMTYKDLGVYFSDIGEKMDGLIFLSVLTTIVFFLVRWAIKNKKLW